MRHPERIPEILQVLQELWISKPDLRLGQIMVIAAEFYKPCRDLFNLEDDEMLQRLQKWRSKIE